MWFVSVSTQVWKQNLRNTHLSWPGIPPTTSDVGEEGGQEQFPVLINSTRPFISDLYQIILKNSSGEALYNIQMQVAGTV